MYEKFLKVGFLLIFMLNNTKKNLEFYLVQKKFVARTFPVNSAYTEMYRFQKELLNFHNVIKK